MKKDAITKIGTFWHLHILYRVDPGQTLQEIWIAL